MPQAARKDENLPHRDTLLLVDDDRLIRTLMTEHLDHMGYRVIEAENGQRALDILNEPGNEIDIIFLDREMPVMDGMTFIANIKRDEKLKNKIIIMSTVAGQPEMVDQGIAAGVFYYLVKPVNYQVLSTIVQSALEESKHRRKLMELTQKQNTGFSLLADGLFQIKTLEEARYVTRLLTQSFGSNETIATGIEALIVNGIEHGNLGIGFELKSQLQQTGNWEHEVARRQESPENSAKKVTVQYQRIPDKHILIIRDDGPGFDWKKYLLPDTAQTGHANGRGIALARQLCFNELTYNTSGNQVIAVAYRQHGQN